MEGAHIRYNCLLQEGADDPTLRDEHNGEWENWLERMTPFPPSWDDSFFWSIVGERAKRIGATKQFVNSWIEETRHGCPDLEKCNELVRLQELKNKGSRARLRAENREGHPSQWIGIATLNYRLPVALQILRDIDAGLNQGGSGV